MVMAGGRLEVPADRSQLPGLLGSPEDLEGYIALIHSCWAQDPALRPSFQDIISYLRCPQPLPCGRPCVPGQNALAAACQHAFP